MRQFVERTLAPRAEEMIELKSIPRDIWLEAGKQGFFGMDIPEEFGGAGAGDYRFNAILAHSGQLVLCPFLPEFRRARVGATLVPDALAAFDALAAMPDAPHPRPGVFSISFGSYPALHVAAKRDVGALTVFGGYATFDESVRFCLEGDADHPHDPLNRPVVFINLLAFLPGAPPNRELLADAWLHYIRRTWGKSVTVVP